MIGGIALAKAKKNWIEYAKTPESVGISSKEVQAFIDECIEKEKENVQYIYIVIDDDAKYQSIKKVLPEFCGIFCNSNAFGLGMVTQIMRKASFITKECEK